MIKARSSNILMSNPAYPRILEEYNLLFKETGGRVNNKKFYEDVIKPSIPSYNINTWYSFLNRFKSNTRGILNANIVTERTTTPPVGEIELHQNLS